jgi:ketosteroid isomerase-like protein
MKIEIPLVALLSAATLGVSPQSPPRVSPALASVVETERAFARMSVDRGRREAFLAFFGDDALFFTPEPVKARPRIQTWPATGPFALDWEPRVGDVARAGDLAYTTGPFIRTAPGSDARILGTGWYFTLWKKQPDGTWKVAVDAGVQGPPSGPLRPSTFQPAATGGAGAQAPPASLLAADRRFCAAIASGGPASAFLAAGTEATRAYRDNLAPMTGGAAIKAYFDSQPGRMSCEPVRDEVSRSADLGYSYGKYSIDGSTPEAGYYLRVWRRRAGEWKLAIDLVIPGA